MLAPEVKGHVMSSSCGYSTSSFDPHLQIRDNLAHACFPINMPQKCQTLDIASAC